MSTEPDVTQRRKALSRKVLWVGLACWAYVLPIGLAVMPWQQWYVAVAYALTSLATVLYLPYAARRGWLVQRSDYER
jgi:hypothetical protein